MPAPPASLECELSLYEKRVDAMLGLLSRADPECAALHRRLQERLSVEDYDAQAYYDHWLAALRHSLVEAGVLSGAEIEARLAVVRARQDAEAG